jgi:hypothetical protein
MNIPHPYLQPRQDARPTVARSAAIWWAVGAGLAGLILGAGTAASGSEHSPVKRVQAHPEPAVTTAAPQKIHVASHKGVTVTVSNGDHLIGDKIPPGTYVSPGAKDDVLGLCTANTRTADGEYLDTAIGGVDEQVIIIVAQNAGLLEIQGCRPFVMSPR